MECLGGTYTTTPRSIHPPIRFVTFRQNPVLNLLAHPQVAKILKNMCFADAHIRKSLVIAKCH